MRHVGIPRSLGDKQFDRFRQMIEQPDASSEHHWCEIDVNCIEQTQSEAFLGNTGSAHDDVLLAGDLPSDLDRLWDSVSDEREG